MANDLDTLLMRMKSAASPARQTLRDLHTKYAADVSGTVANYIPELAKANPEWLGISIVSVVPGKLAIGVFSPRLDARGKSARGIKVCQELSHRLGLHLFESSPNSRSLFDRQTTVLPALASLPRA